MARYHGYVGYAIDVEAYPGVWEERISEHEYFGDVLKNRINMQQGSVVNAKITISNSISIIADPFAFEHVYAMRYVTYLGKKMDYSKCIYRKTSSYINTRRFIQ